MKGRHPQPLRTRKDIDTMLRDYLIAQNFSDEPQTIVAHNAPQAIKEYRQENELPYDGRDLFIWLPGMDPAIDLPLYERHV